MRVLDHQQSQMFSYLSPETRMGIDHPLQAIRSTVDEVLAQEPRISSNRRPEDDAIPVKAH
jgi:hypothetical protein